MWLVWCSTPIPCSIAAGLLVAYILAASLILSAGTQVISATFSGGYSRARSTS